MCISSPKPRTLWREAVKSEIETVLVPWLQIALTDLRNRGCFFPYHPVGSSTRHTLKYKHDCDLSKYSLLKFQNIFFSLYNIDSKSVIQIIKCWVK